VGSGDLLPNVDPTDVATWACLLQDLVDASGLLSKGTWPEEIAWCRSHAPLEGSETWERDPNVVTGWSLVVWANGGDPTHEFTLPNVFDPAEALVRARIQLREAP
jgi:hypothetical protein